MLNYQLKSIKGKTKFDFIFNNAFKFYEKDTAIFVCYRAEASADHSSAVTEPQIVYYAVSARKRNVRKAVMRNRIKRLLRESIRQIFADYTAKGKQTRLSDFVIVRNSAPERPGMIKLNDVLPVVKKLIDRAESFKKNKQD